MHIDKCRLAIPLPSKTPKNDYLAATQTRETNQIVFIINFQLKQRLIIFQIAFKLKIFPSIINFYTNTHTKKTLKNRH